MLSLDRKWWQREGKRKKQALKRRIQKNYGEVKVKKLDIGQRHKSYTCESMEAST